jgi:hypothetical protein
MRDDQFTKLEALQEKLCDVVLTEADPDNWPGQGKLPKDLTQTERGDRYWCKKNAAQSFVLLNKTLAIAARNIDEGALSDPEAAAAEDNMDKEIARLEKTAAKQLERFEQKKKLKAVK